MQVYVKDSIKNQVSNVLDREKSFKNILGIHKTEYEKYMMSLFPHAEITVEINEGEDELDIDIQGDLLNYVSSELESLIINSIKDELYSISDDILKENKEWIVYKKDMAEEVLKN